MVISLVGMITFFLISVRPSVKELIQQRYEVLAAVSIFAICIYVLNLPFMVLAFVTPFFRERFYAYFHLKSMPINSTSGTEKPQSGELGQMQ
jgi:hypothetical protein